MSMSSMPSVPFKTSSKSRLDRRRFLQGASATLSLPFLESAIPVSKLTAAEKVATAGLRNPRKMICIGTHLGFVPQVFFPKGEGMSYEMSQTLKPLADFKREMTVYSNLDHALKGGHNGVHGFLSGVKKEESGGFPEKNITLDQVAAEHVGAQTRYASITTGIGDGTQLCWSRAGVAIPPVNNPAVLFKALFQKSDEKANQLNRKRMDKRSSSLDVLNSMARDLNRKLNKADQHKLDQYLTSVREVEKKLQMSKVWLDKPKPQSPIDPIANETRMDIENMPLLLELLKLAFQTDSTRVATFELPLGFNTSELNLDKYHGLSHHGKDASRLAQLKVVEGYIMKQVAVFFKGLKDAGIYDDTLAIVGSGMGNASSHSNKNLPVILAGGGLKHKGHYVCPEEEHKRIPLSNLWLSALQWFGCERERFGRSTGTFAHAL